MNIRDVVRSILPPIVVSLYRKIRKHHVIYFWHGIYDHYRDVPVLLENHGGNIWCFHTCLQVVEFRQKMVGVGKIPVGVSGGQSLLPLVVALVFKELGSVRILDFGGGAGIDYLYCLAAVESKSLKIDYHIVEFENICLEGKKIFASDSQIHFHSSLPDEAEQFQIVHIDAALQYVEDYAVLLSRLCKYNPKYFLFIRLSAGDFPTYASLQVNVPGMQMAHWFINIGEIVEIMKSQGYSLLYKSTVGYEYNYNNFPKKYQMGPECNLLFARD